MNFNTSMRKQNLMSSVANLRMYKIFKKIMPDGAVVGGHHTYPFKGYTYAQTHTRSRIHMQPAIGLQFVGGKLLPRGGLPVINTVRNVGRLWSRYQTLIYDGLRLAFGAQREELMQYREITGEPPPRRGSYVSGFQSLLERCVPSRRVASRRGDTREYRCFRHALASIHAPLTFKGDFSQMCRAVYILITCCQCTRGGRISE